VLTDSLDDIVVHLAHDRGVVNVTSFKPADDNPLYVVKNTVDENAKSCFHSDYRRKEEDILYALNNWICYNFEERFVMPTYYIIHSYCFFSSEWRYECCKLVLVSGRGLAQLKKMDGDRPPR